MSKLPRLLSLFDGTGGLSRVFTLHNWTVQSLDINPKHGATLVCDILDWDYRTEPVPDVLFAGPPCEEYSIAHTVGPRNLTRADEIIRKTWEIISYFLQLHSGLIYFIENPDTSLLWKRQVSAPFPHRVRLDYCTYGAPFRKRTKIATNSSYVPKPFCNPSKCHACVGGRHRKSAQRGPSLCCGVAPIDDTCTLDELHGYPPELCRSILDFCQCR
jgi:hypothetical protein